jgi:hypothetical protein
MATSEAQKRAWADRLTKPVSKHAKARAQRGIAKTLKKKTFRR